MCDYGLEVTNGSKPLDVVPIAVRHPLIITWVQIKQMLGQQINKNLGSDGPDDADVSSTQGTCIRECVTKMMTCHPQGRVCIPFLV